MCDFTARDFPFPNSLLCHKCKLWYLDDCYQQFVLEPAYEMNWEKASAWLNVCPKGHGVLAEKHDHYSTQPLSGFEADLRRLSPQRRKFFAEKEKA